VKGNIACIVGLNYWPQGENVYLLEPEVDLEDHWQKFFHVRGDKYAERLYVAIHDAFEANPSSLRRSHPQFRHRSQAPGPFISYNCECDCPPFSIMHGVAR
jgi:hypothetical protein